MTVFIAVSLPILLGLAGVAVDSGVWYRESMRLQLAADAAAMGAARLLPSSSATNADYQAAGLAEAQAVTSSRWIGTLKTPIAASVSSTQVTVTLTSTADSLLLRALKISPPTLTASATAGVTPSNTCALALGSPGIQVNNMGSITASGCGIFSDATGSQAIYLDSGTISGSSVGAVGTVGHSNSGSNSLSPSPGNSNAAAQGDPYASLTAPTPGSCNYNNANYTSYGTYAFTASQNVFCGNTTIGGNGSTDSFGPGIYYVVNGNLTFNNAAISSAQGVTFVLTGSSPGAFSWTNYSNTTTLTAPTSGPTAGILIWQTCPSSGSAPANTFAGGSTLQISGELYTPCGQLNLSNNAHLTTVSGASMGVVASNISVVGSAVLSPTSSGGSGGAGGQISLTN